MAREHPRDDGLEPRAHHAGGSGCGRYIGGYLRGTVATAIVKSVAAFVLLLLLGVPYPAPLAVLVFFGGFVPYVGAFVTATLLVLAAIGASGSARRDPDARRVRSRVYVAIRVLVTPRVYGGSGRRPPGDRARSRSRSVWRWVA